MNRLHILLFVIGLMVTNAFADGSKISVVKNMKLPLYEKKSFKDLAAVLKNAKWETGADKNVVKLSGFFIPRKGKNTAKVTLNYTIVLDNHNGLKTVTITDFVYEKNKLIKIHKWEYKSNKWSSAKWRTYSDYENNPNKTYYQESTYRATRFFQTQLYPDLFG